MMEYFLTEEQKMIRDLVREIAAEKIAPKAAELDETEEFPWDILKTLARADLSGVWVPERYGGLGGGVFELCLVTEEIARACCGVATAYAASALGSLPIFLAGTEEQKQKYLPPVARGEKLAAFGLTEPNAGSDAGAIQTTATKDGDSYVLNGTKQWITGGGEADIYTIIASVDRNRGARGITAFIVEKGTPGFDFGKKEKKMGIRCSSTRELIFQDCRIPKENLLGKEGRGFMITMGTLDYSRPGIGAEAVGLAQGALDAAVDYARTRVQFGKPIASFQGVQFLLADMATEIEAARALVYAAAKTVDSGAKDFGREVSMAKLFASDMAMKVTIDAVQIFGGYGYMRDYPMEKRMRDAKILQIYEGTNQIQREVVALSLIKESAARGKKG